MKNLFLIVAIGKNRELGKNNDLIWHLPKDLQFFKKITLNKTIIMGRKTFESLPGILPKRKHIILTSNETYQIHNTIVLHSIEEVLDYVATTDEECFVIGGSIVFELLLPYCDNLYITEIEAADPNANVYMVEFPKNKYVQKKLLEIEENGIRYKRLKYTKKL